MKIKLLSLCVVALMSITQSYGGVTLSVPQVNITPGGTSNVVIYFDLGIPAYTAYQFDIAYPEGISSVNDSDGNPAFTPGEVYNSHSVSSGYAPDGKARFQCFSLNSVSLTAQSGTLLIIPIKAVKSLAEGTYEATISPIEFTQTDATPDRPDAVTFNIKVTNTVVLDENSTTAPAAASGVNVKVLRTINANEWSTICLPFAMNETQVTTAFGNNVQLGDFTGCTVDNDDNITANFSDVTVIDANHPYIIKVSSPISEFTVDDVTIAPGTAEVKKDKSGKWYNCFIGNYVNETVLVDGSLFLYDNKFYFSTGTTKIKAFRAYFSFDAAGAYYESRIAIAFDETTVIREINTNDNNNVYDLRGLKVKNPAKGIYVKDGKKVIIK